jgi:twitching motility protein PilT
MLNFSETIFDLIASGRSFSDILVESEGPIMLKTAQGWVDSGIVDFPSWSDISDFLAGLDPSWEMVIKEGAMNRPLDLHSCRLRINAYLAFGGKSLMASIRIIPNNPPVLADLGLPAATRLLLENPNGLILVSGPTGSGKTTSLAAMVDVINETRNAHIITIEDPIEFVFNRKKSVFSQREIGVDSASFFVGVKDAMRQRPDVIVIGEIRDRDTAEQAIIAGESGHLVIGTLHAGSAVGTISKLLGFFTAQERESRMNSLAGSLVGIVNQSLIPRKDGNGYALAVDFIANHKRQHSRVLHDPDKLQASLDRNEDGVSVGLASSVTKLIQSGVVDKADAAKAVAGNASVYDKIRNL